MKKTLLFLMGVCLTFFSQAAGSEESFQYDQKNSKFMIAIKFFHSMKTYVELIKINKKRTRSNSPISVACGNFKKDTIAMNRQVSFDNNTADNSDSESDDSCPALLQTLTLRHPSTLEDQFLSTQASDVELSVLVSLARQSSKTFRRIHSSRSTDLCDCPVIVPTPENDAGMKLRSDSNATEMSASDPSDFYLGSVSYSPGKSNKCENLWLIDHNLCLTPDLNKTPSPRNK